MGFRKQKPSDLSRTERAVRFIYLNRYCFNGLYRTNQRGEFNVPFGADSTGQLPTPSSLQAVAKTLAHARLVYGDFGKTLALVRRNDFVYLDPPFATPGRRTFCEYDRAVFSAVDILRLRVWMDQLHRKGARFLVSYAECEESEWLARGYCKEYLRVRRHIAGFSGNRAQSSEILISNS